MIHPIGDGRERGVSGTCRYMTIHEKSQMKRSNECGELLEQIATQLELDDNELATLFGVDGAEMQRWLTSQVPTSRLSNLADVWMVVMDLSERLVPGALPKLARKPATALGNRSLLASLAINAGATRNRVERFMDQLDPPGNLSEA